MFSNENKMQRNWFSDLLVSKFVVLDFNGMSLWQIFTYKFILAWFSQLCTYKNMHFQLISVESWMRVDTVNVCIWHFVWIFLVFILWFLFKKRFFLNGQLNRLIFFGFCMKMCWFMSNNKYKFKRKKCHSKMPFHFRAICYCFDIYLS